MHICIQSYIRVLDKPYLYSLFEASHQIVFRYSIFIGELHFVYMSDPVAVSWRAARGMIRDARYGSIADESPLPLNSPTTDIKYL